MTYKRVIVESPFHGKDMRDRQTNKLYAIKCCYDVLERDEYPFASHLFYPEILDEDIKDERDLGIQGQLAWMEVADLVAVYVDRGISGGMNEGIEYAKEHGIDVVYRLLFVPDEEWAMMDEVPKELMYNGF